MRWINLSSLYLIGHEALGELYLLNLHQGGVLTLEFCIILVYLSLELTLLSLVVFIDSLLFINLFLKHLELAIELTKLLL